MRESFNTKLLLKPLALVAVSILVAGTLFWSWPSSCSCLPGSGG